MRVKRIRWLSKGADEAEVTLSDGFYECEAYSQPCFVKEGDILDETLRIFGASEVMLSDRREVCINKIHGDGFKQAIIAKVSDYSQRLVSVGGINLVLDEAMPGAIDNGDLVSIKCSRIDLW